MVAKTYYSKITTGITLFTGYTTNIPAAGTATPPAKDELTASIVPLSSGYPSGSSIKMFSKVSGVGVGQWAKGYTASTLISGVTLHGYVRGGATKSFWMKSYTSAGVLHQSGSATAVLGPTTDAQAHIVFTGQSVTVPAGGALVISTDYSGTGRMYIGMNPKTNNDPNFPDSMVVELDEAAVSSGEISTLPSIALSITANTPQVIAADNNTSQIASAVLTITPNNPQVVATESNYVAMATAVLTVAPNSPQITTSNNNFSTQTSADVILTGNAPSFVATEHHLSQPPDAALILTPNTPQLVTTENHFSVLPSASLSITANALQVVSAASNISQLVTVALSVIGSVPSAVITENHFSVLPSATLSLTANAPQIVSAASHISQLPVAALSLTANAPQTVVTENNISKPLSALLIISTAAPQIVVTASDIAYIDGTTAATNTATILATEPPGTQEDDVVVALVTIAQTDGVWTDPTDFIEIDQVSATTGSGQNRSYIGYKVRGPTAGDGYQWDFSGSNGNGSALLMTYRNVKITDVLDVIYSRALHYDESINDLNAPASPITTNTDGAKIVLLYTASGAAFATVGPPATYSQHKAAGGTNRNVWGGDKALATAGTDTPGAYGHTVDSGQDVRQFTIALKSINASDPVTVSADAYPISRVPWTQKPPTGTAVKQSIFGHEIVSVLAFNEEAGDLIDYVTGTVVTNNGATWEQGNLGSQLRFDRLQSDYLNIPNRDSFDFGNEGLSILSLFTVDAVIAGDYGIISKRGNTGGWMSFRIQISGVNDLYEFTVNDSITSAFPVWKSTLVSTADTPIALATSWSKRGGGSGDCSMVINGALQTLAFTANNYGVGFNYQHRAIDDIGIGRHNSDAPSDYLDGSVRLNVIIKGRLSDDALISLTDNPWQIFEPRRVPLLITESAPIAQITDAYPLKRIPWAEQPPPGILLDQSNPLSAGLINAWVFNQGAGVPDNLIPGGLVLENGDGLGANEMGWGTDADGVHMTSPNATDKLQSTTNVNAATDWPQGSYIFGLKASVIVPSTNYRFLHADGDFESRIDNNAGSPLEAEILSGIAGPGPGTNPVTVNEMFIVGTSWEPTGANINLVTYLDGGLYFDDTPPSSGTVSNKLTLMTSAALPAQGFLGNLYFYLQYDRVLTADEQQALGENPWQIFEPRREPLLINASAPAGENNAVTMSTAALTITANVLDAVTTESNFSLLPAFTSLAINLDFPTVLVTENNFSLLPAFTSLAINLDFPTVLVTENNFSGLVSATVTLTPNVPQAITTENNFVGLPSVTLAIAANVPQSVTTERHISQLGTATLSIAPNNPDAVTTENTIVSLPSASLSIAANNPDAVTTELNYSVLPSVALTITGNAPQAITTQGEVALLGFASLILTTNVPSAVTTENHFSTLPSVTLAITANAPQSVTTEKNISVEPNVSLVITPNAPQAITTQGEVSSLPSVALSLTPNAIQANITEHNVTTLTSAVLALAAQAPQSVTTERNITALSTAVLTITPNNPQAIVTAGEVSFLPSAALSITPNAPQVVVVESNDVTLPSASLVITPNNPQAVVVESNDVSLPSATLTITPNNPQFITTAGEVVFLPTVTLTIVGNAPQASTTEKNITQLQTVTLNLVANVPQTVIAEHHIAVLQSATLTLTPFAPQAVTFDASNVSLPSASLALAANTPQIVTTNSNIVSMQSAALTITTNNPTVFIPGNILDSTNDPDVIDVADPRFLILVS